jgi:hypothetical protein
MAKGGAVAVDGEETPRAKTRPDRQWGNVGKAAEDLPPAVEKKKKGGVIKRRPTSKKKMAKGEKLPVPMVTDEDMGAPPVRTAMAGPPSLPTAMPAGPAPPPPMPPPAMAKGGECKAMAAGGVAKLRRGYPKTNGKAKVKKMAKGGGVRGCGAATKGKGFSGIY